MNKNQNTNKLLSMKLKESEEVFRTFSEQSLFGIYLIEKGNFVYVNPKFADIFGYTVDECLNKINFRELVHQDDLAFVESQVNKRMAEKTPSFKYAFKGLKKNGEMIHIEIYGSSILYKGKPAATGTLLDVTKSKQAEEINKTLFTISNAVNNTPNLTDLYRSIHDSLGNIMDVTNFFIAMVDIKKHTLHFPYYVDTVDDDYSPISKFDANDSLTGLVVKKQKPVLLKKKQLKELKQQNSLWGTEPAIWMGVPLKIKGEVIGVVALQSYFDPNLYNKKDMQVLSSVSDQIAIAINRKRSEDALKDSEKKYKQLFKNAPSGICEIDYVKGRLINVNDIMCKYTGYTEKEFLSMDPLDFLSPDSKKLYMKRIERLSKNEKVDQTAEHTMIKKDGKLINILLNNDYIYKDGKLKGARIVVHDITALKRSEADKIKAQKVSVELEKMALVGQIAGKIAHDFNNMLAVIMGNTALAIMDCKDAAVKKTLDVIYKETIKGKNLTKNLVAFAKDQEPRQEFFRIYEKIDLVINLLRKDLDGIKLIRENKPGVPELFADPGMIENAIINLIQNSIHALSKIEHPQITIQTYYRDNHIFFEIEDNGCGIPKDELKNIFVPSFTLKGNMDARNSYSADIKGTGYGISNVKKYIDQHNGHISVKSVFGSGTKITVSLPVIQK